MRKPLVSVIIPAYNAERWIEEAIASVLGQTITDLEVLVVDDGSNDNTSNLAKGFSDQRVKVLNKANGGVSTARNAGIEAAKGTYLAFLDADDLMTPESLKQKVGSLESNGVDWVFSDIWRCDESLHPLGPAEQGTDGDVAHTILSGRGIGIPGISSNILAHRRCFENGLKFDPNLSNSADQDMAVRLCQEFSYTRLPMALNKYRTSSGSMSRNIALYEKDHLYFMRKARASGLLDDPSFRRKCMANAFWAIGGSWWKNAGERKRAIPYFLKALYLKPSLILRPFKIGSS